VTRQRRLLQCQRLLLLLLLPWVTAERCNTLHRHCLVQLLLLLLLL
jgi:hypothetical protein